MYYKLLLIAVAGVASTISAMDTEVTKKELLRSYLQAKKRECPQYDPTVDQEPAIVYNHPVLKPEAKKRRTNSTAPGGQRRRLFADTQG